MNITIEKASIEQKTVLGRLLELYIYDFTEFTGQDVNEHGLYGYKYLDHYWTEPERFPFLIKVDGKYAGFALVRKIAQEREELAHYSIAEFFIMKKYRKNGVGREAAFQIFDSFPGNWEVAQIETNIPAQQFWRKVIAEYTNNNYEEGRKDGWEGFVQSFLQNKK